MYRLQSAVGITYGFFRAVASLILFLTTMSSGHAGSVVLKPIADTSLFEAFADQNTGANENMVAGANASLDRGRAIFRFDIAGAIPSNAIIQTVSLALTVVLVPPDGGEPSIFDLRRLLKDWGEGTGTNNTGTPTKPGEANWNARFYPTNLWSIPGGAISNDFSEVVSASLLLGDLGAYTFNSTSNLVSDVRLWLRNPGTNFGWMLISESENIAFTVRRIGARERITNAPLLTVNFAVPPTLQLLKADVGNVQIGFQASAGQSYSVQFRDSLNNGDWLTLTHIPPQSTTTNVTVVELFATNSQRFYRVALE